MAAKTGGADRLEVCSSLALGGTTPSYGLVKQCVADLQAPVMMMIRPHDGGFVYSDNDLDTMLNDIEIAKSIGVQGVVFGALNEDRTINVAQCRMLVEAAGGIETTFHRAFDIVPDPLAAVRQLQEFGVSRILTSGQAPTAPQGGNLIRELASSQSEVAILAGAGVRPANVAQLLTQTGVREVHSSASASCQDAQKSEHIQFGETRTTVDVDIVRALKDTIRNWEVN